MSHNEQNAHDAPDEALNGRYASSIGWDPNRPKFNERDLARKPRVEREHALIDGIEQAVEQTMLVRELVRLVRELLHETAVHGGDQCGGDDPDNGLGHH